jgi:hypothetical protein
MECGGSILVRHLLFELFEEKLVVHHGCYHGVSHFQNEGHRPRLRARVIRFDVHDEYFISIEANTVEDCGKGADFDIACNLSPAAPRYSRQPRRDGCGIRRERKCVFGTPTMVGL